MSIDDLIDEIIAESTTSQVACDYIANYELRQFDKNYVMIMRRAHTRFYLLAMHYLSNNGELDQ
jgi:hypothetical protein